MENDTGSLMDFALSARERFREQARRPTTGGQSLYLSCLVGQENSPWRPGSTYLVTLTPDGRVFIHAKDMSLSGRQLTPQSALDFATRLPRPRNAGTPESFSEKGVGCEVFVVGNVAIAAAGCEMTENASKVTRDVSVFLLVKNSEGWHIAAQARDVVDDVPAAFAAAGLRLDP